MPKKDVRGPKTSRILRSSRSARAMGTIIPKTEFLTLPNEIIVELLWVIDPYDLPSFCLTCKTFYELSGPRRRDDKPLTGKYKIWETGDNRRRPADLLRDVIETPRIALYVQRVRIQLWWTEWQEHHPRDHEKDMSVL